MTIDMCNHLEILFESNDHGDFYMVPVLLQAEGDAFFNPNDDGGKAQGAENLYGENR